MNLMKDFIIGTAGHIDHGKTTLIQALTGINTDRLAEEKRRGITIDIGFAHMNLDDLRIGFVDVPGHEKFVKNMLAGIGGIELVLLVVAADESVMPQTREHFQICRLLEIPRGIVVITKKKLAEPGFLSLVEEEVRELIRGSLLEDAPIVAVDSVSGDGIPDLVEVIRDELRELRETEAASRKIFRLPIDRVFSLQGFGTVVTGTPVAGSIRKGQILQAYPTQKTGKIRGIEVFGQKEDEARSGRRTAVNITGMERADLERGMTLAPPGSFEPSSMFDVVFSVLANAPGPVHHRNPVRFHHGSGEIIGRIHLMDRPEIEPGGSGYGQLRLETPTVACPLDHFVLRRYSPMTTIGGGIILDNSPRKLSRKVVDQALPDLKKIGKAREEGPSFVDRVLVEYVVRQSQEAGIPLTGLTARTGFSRAYVSELLEHTDSVTLVPQEPPIAVSRACLEKTRNRLLQFLQNFHSRNPLAPGVPQEELKNRFLKRAGPGYFQFFLDRMIADGRISVNGALVSRSDHRIQLNDHESRLSDQILSAYKSRDLSCPSLAELLKASADPEGTRRVFFYLLQSGQLVRITEEFVLSSSQVEWLKDTVRSKFESGDSLGVAEFKDLFGLSRKYAIPFLEFLDREKVTRRIGDRRLVV